MSKMVVEYFQTFGHISMNQLQKECENKLQDVKKSRQSLAPFAQKWAQSKKLSTPQEREAIINAFVNSDLDFEALSEIYVKSREMPLESRNFTFVNDVMVKVKPLWGLYGPTGVDLLAVLDVLVSMGDWLFPDEKPEVETITLDIPKKSKKRKESESNPNLVEIPRGPPPDVAKVKLFNIIDNAFFKICLKSGAQ